MVTMASVAHGQDVGSASPASQPASNKLVLFNQIQSLQVQTQQMQGQIEQLQHQLQQLKKTNAHQFDSLNARVGKLAQAGAASAAAPAGSAPAPSSAQTAASASTTATGGAPSAATKAAAEKAYNAAFKTLRQGDYVASARGFRAFIAQYPRSSLAPNGYYWLGESYYVTQNFKVALQAFQTLVKKYPTSRKAPDARLKIGYCQFEMKQYASARRSLEAVIQAYPGTAVERRAKSRLDAIPASASTQ
jgi:tol-pal system protein YbgF